MIDRDKVNRGLELCAYDPDPGQELKEIRSCPECPYYRAGCSPQLIREALDLLKAQEPRVMTLEEAKKAMHEEGRDVIYWEERTSIAEYKLTIGVRVSEIIVFPCEEGLSDYVEPDVLDDYDATSVYGKEFRLWTSRPTPEQMRDTKWEGENDA